MGPASVDAAHDLQYIRAVLERTQQRIDPHAFHNVHWGLLVLVWYPLANYFSQIGHENWQVPLGIAAICTGTLLSVGREMLLSRRPRLEGENTFIGKQVAWIVAFCIGAGVLLSGFAPATGFVDGKNVPVIWGLVYATLAIMTGVVYTRDFLVCGVLIFGGSLLAMIFSQYNGYILGPFMGLGIAIPGWIAERRVRRMQEESVGGAAAAV